MPLNLEQRRLIRKHSLDVKHDYQLAAMRVSHADKLARLRERGGDYEQHSDPDGIAAIRWELKQQGLFPQEVINELLDRQSYIIWKNAVLSEIVDTIDVEVAARASGEVSRSPIGTEYFLDGDGGNNASDGLSVGNAWLDLDKFTESARSAGDIVTVKRGTTIDNGTDIAFTSDGTKADPIIIRADNANAFSTDVDLSITATATFTFGSKIVTYSSDISGVLSAGDWIYAASDDADEFAYEVDTVVTTTVTLFLPYKGAQAGSGKTTTNLGANPIWNTAAGDFQWQFNADDCWKVQGIHIRGTDAAGNVELNTAMYHAFKDCIFEGNGSGDSGLDCNDDTGLVYVLKCRFINQVWNLKNTPGSSGMSGTFRDCLFDGSSVGSSKGGVGDGIWAHIDFIDCEFKNHADSDINASTIHNASVLKLRNCILSSTTEINVNITSRGAGAVFSEDHDGSLNVSAQYSGIGSGSNTPIIESDTGTVRSGGGAISGKCTPSTNLGTNWELSRQLLFEIAFYATTTSKKYEIFFRPTATADWTADPTASELWIELEYWGHASNNFRRITKSTGVIDMNGSTTFTALDVTVEPSQAGVAYLRGYYAKTKESGKANTFFWDTVPVVT